MITKKLLSDSLKIFRQGVNAVLPEELIRRNVKYDPALQVLTISDEVIDLREKNVHIVGTGKAVKSMAQEMEKLLGTKIKSGIISVPNGSLKAEAGCPCGSVKYYEGAENNLPDSKSEATANKIKNLVSELRNDDILIVLISGGGSALLVLPTAPIKLEEKTALIKALASAGADIVDLNTVRKKLSDLKGGRLARMAQPARVVALLLSDIVGDPLHLIASGPTVPDGDPPLKAKEIIDKYKLFDTLPESIKSVLIQEREIVSFPHDNVSNHVIGSNKLSLQAALQEATALGYPALVVSSEVTGNVIDVAEEYITLAKCLCDCHYDRVTDSEADTILRSLSLTKCNEEFYSKWRSVVRESKVCLILGGETTVRVRGGGRGGRNQQLALEVSKRAPALREAGAALHVLCAGTDGADGPTDAAGAAGYDGLFAAALRQALDVDRYLQDNDSYTFYEQFDSGQLHVKTGLTHTNVMDVHIIILTFE